jgi:hypothetical protein
MKERKGYNKAKSIKLKSGIKGGTQVNISSQGLITLGSGLVSQLGIDNLEDGYSVQLYDNDNNTNLTIDILNVGGEHNWRKGGKVNCKPQLRDLKLDWIQKLINQVPDENGKVKVSSITCNDTTLSTDGEIVIDVKEPK